MGGVVQILKEWFGIVRLRQRCLGVGIVVLCFEFWCGSLGIDIGVL
jgi:hypothetical protein